MPVDIWLDAPVAESASRARELRALGVDGVFTFEGAHDVFMPLTLAATAGVDIMTNVAMAFPRSPMHLAHTAWDLQALSGGRFRLGLGSQIRAHIEKRYGSVWSEPVERMRDTVLATQAILRAWQTGERLDYRGRFRQHTLMTPQFDPGPNPFGVPPVLVGALGPRMTEMAAQVADGLLVMPFNTERNFRERTLAAVDKGLAGSDRPFQIVVEAIVAMGDSEEEWRSARRAVRNLLAFYGSTPSYRPVLEVEGWEDLQPELNVLSKQGRWQEMAGLIDDPMVDALTVSGTPAECAELIRTRFGDNASRVCCYFPGYQVTDAAIADLVAALHS
ncbi:TIGR03617 family F420-dependent LLM class oxidoreductase [Nocardia seriolae]|uniref:TIGR03617 family F420-dependent LLM class oxidoreductase n=1 Tax=Nocardia seriolae TaxID=37332 RepID=UPI00051A8598|nr:TIGR03617 family F420-dependent LLM class oxidoreductase [Nocardia seriolae]MTJ60332.1 TIGR03617 family F420-dependent LLM class oxidoreductase [Nocardia seriolae]MTJ76153.1 TIGR03617 family F420-dependent LLM class oxidoreductase [Nocardia seriolae]MTJ84831.1 TIGR03617 family F420-dependent LLM class oxidoreductase [Nocardia seriolae]MTK28818.1 TIGR03617 family F420-dependent LLM class oxidoreductase [Nocardia seriolae]MTK38260.1 TIGR03617 family F420-dependent LLM class oxidoreductase [No